MNGLNCGYLPTVSMCHVVFIFSLGDGYLDSFHFLDIANNVFGNMRKHISPQQTDFFSLGKNSLLLILGQYGHYIFKYEVSYYFLQ